VFDACSETQGRRWISAPETGNFSRPHQEFRASKRTSLRPIGWHTLRHSFASHLVAYEVPLKAVQGMLGHASIEMTCAMPTRSPDVKKDVVRALEGHTGAHGAGREKIPSEFNNLGMHEPGIEPGRPLRASGF
jgi:hypothetical protein